MLLVASLGAGWLAGPTGPRQSACVRIVFFVRRSFAPRRASMHITHALRWLAGWLAGPGWLCDFVRASNFSRSRPTTHHTHTHESTDASVILAIFVAGACADLCAINREPEPIGFSSRVADRASARSSGELSLINHLMGLLFSPRIGTFSPNIRICWRNVCGSMKHVLFILLCSVSWRRTTLSILEISWNIWWTTNQCVDESITNICFILFWRNPHQYFNILES